ncbi:MAG: single-stranded DNA-binding protein [Planctomycetota bacterium]|jgi:single-strand DNA-binding protein
MANFNKVLLMGNLTRDPQLTYLPSQTAVVDFGLATNRRWKSQDGQQREETCFIDCRAFGRMAENINKYLTKGRPVFIEGRLTFDSWTAQDGSKRSRHRVTVENFQFLSGGNAAAAGESAGIQGAQTPAQTPAADSDDDIPF